MPDFIYCGTGRYVDANGTQQLLCGPFNAIWYPPGNAQYGQPTAGARLWLVWRKDNAAIPVLLGGGLILITDIGNVLWQDATLPGVAQAARNLRYPGPPHMDFLHLENVLPEQNQPAVNIPEPEIHSGLNVATREQIELLERLLPILRH